MTSAQNHQQRLSGNKNQFNAPRFLKSWSFFIFLFYNRKDNAYTRFYNNSLFLGGTFQ